MSKTQGKATHAQLHELHRLVTGALVTELKNSDTPSAEVLAVARAVLKDNGLTGLAQTEVDRRALQRLWLLLVANLAKAMQGNPSASMVQEVRLFLAANGVTKDFQGHAAKAQALSTLADATLPFVKH